MLLQELNSEFEVLFEDLSTAGSKGLDTYERSLCFTVAQDRIITTLARQRNLAEIQDMVSFNTKTTFNPSPYRNGNSYTVIADTLIDLDFVLRNAYKDIPAILVPMVVINNMLGSPYKYPPRDLAYVVVGENAYIVFPPLFFSSTSFVTKYVKTPPPIILADLEGTDSIRSVSLATQPVLKDSYQDELVDAAVKYAIHAYIGVPEKEVSNDSRRNKQ